ncbi:hypothetical protein M8818_007855 [Zalaria obscura]|uniref:Uncharacterized protein n=1 Tax=Zalaria obscura TaxID=2024903 RepID=A0ACC3S6J7_9PEZI
MATPPRAAAWPVPQSLNDESSILVEFYFKETAVVFSCYDSPLNPFRTTVSALWENSPVMYYTLQSMAAASLTDSFPQLASMGPQLRKKAITLLEKEDAYDHKSLLALLMLGGTASWHDPRDLGLTFFNTARKRLETMSTSGNNNARFFEEALIYWEMLLSFVTDNDDLMPLKDGAYTKEYNPLRKVPHPWTGIARDCQYAVQEVGRLIRHERKLAHARNFATHARIKQLRQAMARAGELEERLLELAHPVESDVVNPEDNETPVWHLLNLAEIYRRTGLIQLYHVFPDLLQRRLPHDESADTEMRGDDTAAPSPGSDKDVSPFVHCDWLTSFALQTLELLKSIPLESGTRDFQPFLLVALCSELRIPRPETTSNTGPSLASTTTTTPSGVFPSGTVPEVSVRSIQVSRMRKVLLGRLTALLHVLPPKPIQLCLNIVKETWSQMDTAAQSGASEADDVYWMDVMIANGWETTMA